MSCKTAGHEFSHDFFSIENKDALFFQVLQKFPPQTILRIFYESAYFSYSVKSSTFTPNDDNFATVPRI